MSHSEYFEEFFRVRKRGTARDITDFLIAAGEHFDCAPERCYHSINRMISRQCGKKRYTTGVVKRKPNADGVFEYYTE